MACGSYRCGLESQAIRNCANALRAQVRMQRTIKNSVSFSGIGLHSGVMVDVEIRPAAANTGIVFCREDLPGSPYIAAKADNVLDTQLATRIGTKDAWVSTIEHLMAAFFGFGIDNAIVSLNNYELPIVDGSAMPFLVLLDEAGIQELATPRKWIRIKNSIEIVDEKDPTRFIRVESSRIPMLSYAIDFKNSKHIGIQNISTPLTGQSVFEELCFARTFCLAEEISYMQSKGLARGGSLENAVVVSSKDGVLNREGLRAQDEFVRHKMLDCVGDLALVGMPIIGHVIAHKAGHDLHTALAKQILQNLSQHEVLQSAREISNYSALMNFPKSLSQFDGLPNFKWAIG